MANNTDFPISTNNPHHVTEFLHWPMSEGKNSLEISQLPEHHLETILSYIQHQRSILNDWEFIVNVYLKKKKDG